MSERGKEVFFREKVVIWEVSNVGMHRMKLCICTEDFEQNKRKHQKAHFSARCDIDIDMYCA